MGLQVIDDSTMNGITTFEFNDSNKVKCSQHHDLNGTPWLALNNITVEQAQAIEQWSGCGVVMP